MTGPVSRPGDRETNTRAGSTDNPSLDVHGFWQEHDAALAQRDHTDDVSLSHDLYRGMPGWFNAYYAHFQRRVLLHFLKKCNVSRGAHALDLGCGTGRWSGLLLALGLQPYGLDVGAQALRYAASKWQGAHFVVAELPSLSFTSNSFDLAVSVTVLQHIPHQQQLQAIQAIRRVLRPGGHLLVCETIDVHDRSPHVFGNHLERWLEMFSQAGFRSVEQAGCEYLPYVKLFHWWQTSRGPRSKADVSHAAQLLRARPVLAVAVRLVIAASYPAEYLASQVLPPEWARLACFLLRKP